MPDILPVILSGGPGTRLWPISRASYPKQFVPDLNGRTSSLLTATLARLSPANGFSAPIVLCNHAHRFLVREHASLAAVTPQAVILEPVARNTGPAIAVAALVAAKTNPSTVLVVMPSDHVIGDLDAFRDAVRRAATFAAEERIVLFGIEPTSPHTGYGYIRTGEPIAMGGETAFEVASFVEKPDAETAEAHLADGCCLWNSGIFVFRADVFLAELERLDPSLLAAARDALQGATEDLGFQRLCPVAFANAPNISVDYAVMEKTDKAAVLPISVSWNDLGAWGALWNDAPRDTDGNFVQGDTLIEDTSDCYIRSERALVSAIGVKDLVIVETTDAFLVANRTGSQDVSKLVARLKGAGRTEHEHHVRTHRPWGYFETLSSGPRFQVKRVHVKPGGILSHQMHHHRSEHWVVVSGTARVTVDGTETLVQENQSVYIVATQWHRLENPGKVPLEVIEVQIGTYLGEDDIVRRDDAYRRGADETG